jgi:hypothetical protein
MNTLILINIWSVVFFGLLTIQTALKIGFKNIALPLIIINSLLNAFLICQVL